MSLRFVVQFLLLASTLLVMVGQTKADAIIRSNAMAATTIAEFYIEDDRVVVELEIGLADLDAFRNLMPDEIYQKMDNSPIPLSQRSQIFFKQDLVIAGDDGKSLVGRIINMQPRPRVKRDEITGEPLPDTDEEQELTVFAQLEYALPKKPGSLTFRSPSGDKRANIGFVVYHKSIAVNDFRYLSPSQTLELDWQDPWYSSFPTRNLRRAYSAPMSGFIYVEPYEVRKEIILRPKDLQHWIDLGLSGRETIPVVMQAEVKRKAAEFLRERQRVVIDEQIIAPELARVNFLQRSLRTSRVIEPPVELDINSAILGVIFVYPTEGLPDRVTMEWGLFNERIQRIPVSSVDQAGPLPTYLEPDFNVLEWQNFLKNPVLPEMQVIKPPSGFIAQLMAYARWFLLAITVAILFWMTKSVRETRSNIVPIAITVFAFVVTTASFWLSRDARINNESATKVVAGLLHNIYHAFDFRKEGQIYDVLEKSVGGDLLTQIYLETRKGLELANQGGARAKVKSIEVINLQTESSDDGFIAKTTLNVSGSVGHWGHVHQRNNQYRAELNIQPVDGVWKLTALEILEEQRL